MPSSLFAELERGGGGAAESLDERRALRLALDQLSLLGLDGDEAAARDGEPRRRSVNMTECVPVPSSEHVAEIVGRQGCKIKALRAKTNTYIKTPVRGEEPVFVVTGRKEDVAMARREIISAAEHFSMIRASRNKSAALSGGGVQPGPPSLPGQTTIQVRVPYRVVGLVVGPKGATIKRIQQQTHTYIVTPSRDKEPVFEVTGMPENVDRARDEIEAHIALRTGGVVELTDDDDFHANGTDVGFELHGRARPRAAPRAQALRQLPPRQLQLAGQRLHRLLLRGRRHPAPGRLQPAGPRARRRRPRQRLRPRRRARRPRARLRPRARAAARRARAAALAALRAGPARRAARARAPGAAPPAPRRHRLPAPVPAAAGRPGPRRAPAGPPRAQRPGRRRPGLRRLRQRAGRARAARPARRLGRVLGLVGLQLVVVQLVVVLVQLVVVRLVRPAAQGQPRLLRVLRERGDRRAGALRAQPLLHGVRQPHLREERAPVPRVPRGRHAGHPHLLLSRRRRRRTPGLAHRELGEPGQSWEPGVRPARGAQQPRIQPGPGARGAQPAGSPESSSGQGAQDPARTRTCSRGPAQIVGAGSPGESGPGREPELQTGGPRPQTGPGAPGSRPRPRQPRLLRFIL